jgi:transcriptional regulator with XRE-family HTH domain
VTNQEMATRVGIHHSMASRLRAGKRLPSVALMRRISTEYGVPLAELVDAHTAGPEAMGSLLRRRVFRDPDPVAV